MSHDYRRSYGPPAPIDTPQLWPSPAPSSSSSSIRPPPPPNQPREPAPAPSQAAKSKSSKRPAPTVLPPDIDGERTGDAKKKRKRTGFACLSCRKRRTKCDGGQPCAACGADDEECCYPDAKVSVKYVQELEAKVRELETAAAAAREQSSLSSSSGISPQPPESIQSSSAPSRAGTHPSSSGEIPTLRVSTVAGTWERTGHDGHAAELIEHAAAILVGQMPPGQVPQPRLSPPTSLSPASVSKDAQHEREDALVDLLDRRRVDGLLHWFLIRLQYVFPVLHWPTFYSRWTDGAYKQSNVHKATLYLVLAISSTLRSKQRDEALAAKYFARAQLNGTELLLTADLDTLTYLLLLCFYSQSCAKNSLSSNAVAHTIFLSRSLISVNLSTLQPLERAMRRRCWAACRQMIATSSGMAYRSIAKPEDDSAFDEELLRIGGVDDGEAFGGGQEGNRLLFFRETVKLFIIKTKILRRSSDPNSLVEHEALLLEFWEGVPAQLKPSSTQDSSFSFTKQVQAAVLRGRYLNAQILLHRPAVLDSISVNAPDHARRYGVRSALSRTSAQECVATAIELVGLVSSSWFTLMHGSWWFSMGYAYSACLVILAYQISQRVRGKEPDAFIETNNLDQQASAAVLAGLNVIRGISRLNTDPPLPDSRGSPDVIAAAGRVRLIVLRLQCVLTAHSGSTNAAGAAQLSVPSGDMPLYQATWDHPDAQNNQNEDFFRTNWERDDEFMDNLLQLLGPGPSPSTSGLPPGSA